MSQFKENKPNFAQILNFNITKLITVYEENNALGIDAYSSEKLYHPMADAKYLTTLAVLYNTNKISMSNFLKRVHSPIERLEKSLIETNNKFSGWGLEFEWRGLSKDEPFLITTSLVVKSLSDILKIVSDNNKLNRLYVQGLVYLKKWCENESTNLLLDSSSLPIYSPNIKEPIYNSAAYASSTILSSDSIVDESLINYYNSILNYIDRKYSRDIGWCYSDNNNRIDLLHQCYILNSLMYVKDIRKLEEYALSLIGHFMLPDGMLDLVSLHTANINFYEKDIKAIRKIGDKWIEIIPKKARLWSLGELLVVISKFCIYGDNKKSWLAFGRKVSIWIIEQLDNENIESTYPRHTMHVVHGLSEYLSVIRKFKNDIISN